MWNVECGMWRSREGAQRPNELTALADGQTCDTRIHWGVIGGLAQKPISLENGQTQFENRAGLPRESGKAFFFRPRYYATVPRSEKRAVGT